jgi:hypothetical protein
MTQPSLTLLHDLFAHFHDSGRVLSIQASSYPFYTKKPPPHPATAYAGRASQFSSILMGLKYAGGVDFDEFNKT